MPLALNGRTCEKGLSGSKGNARRPRLSARLLSQEGGSFWRFSQDRRIREAVHPGRRLSQEPGSAMKQAQPGGSASKKVQPRRRFSQEAGSERKEAQPGTRLSQEPGSARKQAQRGGSATNMVQPGGQLRRGVSRGLRQGPGKVMVSPLAGGSSTSYWPT